MSEDKPQEKSKTMAFNVDPKIKRFVLSCIEQTRGDNLYRARLAFRDCTEEEMEQKYAQSGQTRRQIIEGYEAHEKLCDDAKVAVEMFL